MELECSICMDNKKIEDIIFLPCVHFLCNSCNDKLKKNECPFCRNKITEENSDSYEETENEYDDVNFEMLVIERSVNRRKRKKDKKYEKKIMKMISNNNEIYISINSRNTYTILNTDTTE
jgi:hypothetical protein